MIKTIGTPKKIPAAAEATIISVSVKVEFSIFYNFFLQKQIIIGIARKTKPVTDATTIPTVL